MLGMCGAGVALQRFLWLPWSWKPGSLRPFQWQACYVSPILLLSLTTSTRAISFCLCFQVLRYCCWVFPQSGVLQRLAQWRGAWHETFFPSKLLLLPGAVIALLLRGQHRKDLAVMWGCITAPYWKGPRPLVMVLIRDIPPTSPSNWSAVRPSTLIQYCWQLKERYCFKQL